MGFGIVQILCTALLVIVVTWLLFFVVRSLLMIFFPKKQGRQLKVDVGNITLEELSKYDGRDPYRPILVALKGIIYDVSSQANFYGPGGGYSIFGGKEVSRALGKMAIAEEECNDQLDDLTEKELETLQKWIDKFENKYPVAGKVVPELKLTLDELAAFDGTQRPTPIYLAIRGIIFDVTRGSMFYGPDGAYPFGGKECARALAKFSTEVSDCNDDLSDCSLAEMDALRDWMAQFYGKYKVVGRVVSSAERLEPAAGAVEAEDDVEQEEEADASTDKNKDD